MKYKRKRKNKIKANPHGSKEKAVTLYCPSASKVSHILGSRAPIHISVVWEEKPLSITFQWSWESREIPVYWEMANVVPVFSKSEKEDPGNYRPVSLISVPGKIMEKIIPGVIEKHLRDKAVPGHSKQRVHEGKAPLNELNFLS